MHIAVAGNIGSGKTTLTKLLSKHYAWTPHYEEPNNNPYLDDFYEDMKRWSFNLQIFFLHSRMGQIMKIRESGKDVIQDRTIFEDARIFAPNLRDMGLMSVRDYENYETIFNQMISLVKAPDLIIYLKASVPTLVNQIQKRGREYEASLRLDYIKSLNERYNAWADNYGRGKLLTVSVDDVNFDENILDLSKVVDLIDAQLHGL